MIYKITVPAVGEDVEEFRVLEWHGAVGRSFAIGELVLELETHKAVVEVRAGQPGVLRQILVADGEWCKIGLPVALFSDDQADAMPKDAAVAGDMVVEFEIT